MARPGTDPLPIPGAAPDVAPFFTVRFNEQWRSILLGAIDDTLDYPQAWDGTPAEQADVLQQLDQLRAMLTQEVTTVTNNGVYLPPQVFRVVYGPWTTNVDPNYSTQVQRYALHASVDTPELRAPITLPAGINTCRVHFYSGPNSAGLQVSLMQGAAMVASWFVPQYSAVESVANLATFTTNLAQDFTGEVMVRPLIGFPGWVSPHTLGHFYSIAFEARE